MPDVTATSLLAAKRIRLVLALDRPPRAAQLAVRHAHTAHAVGSEETWYRQNVITGVVMVLTGYPRQ